MQQFRTMLKFGSGLFRLCPGKVLSYLSLSFMTQVLIPLAIPVLLAKLTVLAAGSPQGVLGYGPGEPPISRGHDIVRVYTFWLSLTLILVPMKILFKLAQTSMDSQMESHVRKELFGKIVRQTPEFFHRYNPAQLTTILNQSTIEAQQVVRSVIIDPALQLASLCLATLLIVQALRGVHESSSWGIVTIMVLFGATSVFIVQKHGQKPVYESQKLFQEQRFAISGLVDSAIKSPEEIQSMDAEALFSGRYASALARLMKLKRRIVLTMEVVNSGIGLPGDIIQGVILGMVVYRTSSHHIAVSPGTLVLLITLTPKLMDPFRTFAAIGITASSGGPAVELVSNLLNAENRIMDSDGSKQVQALEPSLKVEHVAFRYRAGLNSVFDGLTFTTSPGKITSLVARMGQGKTTFFRLALRFYEPENGQILVGGFPTSELTLKSLRQHVVMMSQFPAFFHDTVRENFRMANPGATDDQILTLCNETGLLPILEQTVGSEPLERDFAAGARLSGGQKRLFALTRCLLRNPTILFLDEPTTNMSNDEKYELIPIMKRACVGRTVLVVDHDIPWLLQFSDYFLVLDGGQIVQEGPGDVLLRRPGLLRDLYSMACPIVENSAASPAPPRQHL